MAGELRVDDRDADARRGVRRLRSVRGFLSLHDDRIWATIDFSSFEESPDVDAELNRRLDRLDAEGPSGIPWESVKAEMTAR
jgi:hypothetical protein